MSISTERVSEKSFTSRVTEAPASLDSTSDMNFFSSKMSYTEPAKTAPTSIIEKLALSDSASHADRLAKRVSRGLRDMSINKNTKDMRELNTTIAEAHQKLVVSVKVVNKCGQFLEKVTNLQ